MENLTEIRWHARAGQGAVTAAKFVAQTALELDKYIQAMPEYGAERMGAPIQAFTRISDDPIEIHCNITDPDIVIVLDDTLLRTVPVAEGLVEEGTVIVNTCDTPDQVRTLLGLDGYGKVFTLDATQIALDTIGRPIPNTPMLGALAKASRLMSLDQVTGNVRKSFSKKFSPEVVEGNVAAVKRAYEEVQSG